MNATRYEITVTILVVTSVVLTLVEFFEPTSSLLLSILDQFNHIITWLFVVKLTFRFLATPVQRHFFQDYWLGMLAVLPLLRVFRLVRVI